MRKQAFNLVSLAIEIIECDAQSVDTSKERVSTGTWSGGYTIRSWAADMLYQLPDDRAKAMMIVKAHMPGGVDPVDRRSVGQLCGWYYRKLDGTGLLKHGERFLKVMG